MLSIKGLDVFIAAFGRMSWMSRYLKHFLWFIAWSTTSALLACKPAAWKDDPIRAEVVEACKGHAAYKSMRPKKRTVYCECIYDKTISGLSEEEKQVARFYLLVQVGVDAKSRNLITKPNMQAMGKASKAIGDAVKRCK